MKNTLSILGLVFVFSGLSFAAPSQAESKTHGIEIGLSAGIPAVFGVQLGYWGTDTFPLVARASLGIGSTLDLGVHLPIDRSETHLILAATAGALGYFGLMQDVLFTAGPTFGVRIGHFNFQAGPCVYFDRIVTKIAAQGQVGFSVFY